MGTKTLLHVLVVGLIGSEGMLNGATPADVELKIVPATSGPVCPTGGTVDVAVLLTNRADEISGWCLGIAVEADPGVDASIREIQPGQDLMTLKNGAPPDFLLTKYYAADDLSRKIQECDAASCDGIKAGAITQVVQIDYEDDEVTLPPVEDVEILKLTVFAAASELGPGETAEARLVFSSSIGNPPVDVVFVADRVSYEPDVQESAVVTVGGASCPVTGAAVDIAMVPAGTGIVHNRDVTGAFSVAITTRVGGLEAWSFAVAVALDPGVNAAITSVRPGDDLATVNDGAMPEFLEIAYYTAGDPQNPAGICDPADASSCEAIGAAYVTQHVVMNQGSPLVSLPARPALSVLNLDLWADAPAINPNEEVEARLVFAEGVGDPPVENAVRLNGETIQPDLLASGVMILELPLDQAVFSDEDFDFKIVPAQTGPVSSNGETVEMSALFTARAAGVAGWSFGIILEPDSGVEASITEYTFGEGLMTAKNGNPPDFVFAAYYASAELQIPAGECEHEDSVGCQDIDAIGIVQGVVIDFRIQISLPAVEDLSMAHFKVHAAAPGLAEGETKEVRALFTTTLGLPPVDSTVAVGSDCYYPAILNPARVSVAGRQSRPTVRIVPGSANADGRLDIADAIFLLSYLFRGGPPPACELAADANGDCVLDSSDAVYVLFHQFLEGPPPAAGEGCQSISGQWCPALTCDTVVETGC